VKRSARLFLLVLIGLSGVLPLHGAEDRLARVHEEFRAELVRSVAEVDRPALRDLFYTAGSDAETLKALTAMSERLMRHEITGIQLLPVPADHPGARIVGNVRYRPSLRVAGYVRLELRSGNRLTLPYGIREGRVYLTSVIRDDLGQRAKQLTVQIAGIASPEPVKVQLSYMAGNKEKTREFVTTTNSSRDFRGQYIKSCRVQKLNDEGWVSLIISEDGEPVYSSGRSDTALAYVSDDD